MLKVRFIADPDLDSNEAPLGFIAVLKESVPHNQGNLCRQCDWRKQCNDPATDLTHHNHRCMGYAVITKDGQSVHRDDRCSVIFKRKHGHTLHHQRPGSDHR